MAYKNIVRYSKKEMCEILLLRISDLLGNIFRKLNENEDIQKNWAGKISSGSWQRLPARTLPHPRRANFVHVWNLRNIQMLKLLLSALTIIVMMIMFCDYCLQTFLSTSTVSFAPLLLNIASISSCPYLRENVWIKPSRWFSCLFTQSFK